MALVTPCEGMHRPDTDAAVMVPARQTGNSITAEKIANIAEWETPRIFDLLNNSRTHCLDLTTNLSSLARGIRDAVIRTDSVLDRANRAERSESHLECRDDL